ncbi:DUF29 family protein [Pseudoduganella eburnea]|uniref:DUF29 family protein n=1 Tax=Massilia eburnea TaxID=1776165 RepID=A0A6L6QIJ2_9BURK|nr:DUF29 domain-containing protein [Massilia eburnea]MTW11456.1 DUF29 family protein [Massilia eburnea]
MNHTAYEEDFIPWVETQAALLRDRKFELLDIPNLYEELTSMASHIRHQLASRLCVLEVHLLKCRYQPLRKSRSWRGTILEQRSRIEMLIRRYPSLQHDLPDEATGAYPTAVRKAARETGLAQAILPTALPFTVDELLDFAFEP